MTKPRFLSLLIMISLVAAVPRTPEAQEKSIISRDSIFSAISEFNKLYTSCNNREKSRWPVHYISFLGIKNSKPIISIDIEEFRIEEDDRLACASLKRNITRGKTRIVEFQNNIYAISKVYYESKYSNYNFLEQYVIKRNKLSETNLNVRIVERVLLNDISKKKSGKFILLYESDYNNLVRSVDKYGALNRDIIFEKMSAKSASQILTSFDTSDIFVAVFIPNFFVKPGSIITIEHLYRRTGEARRWYSYGQDFKVNKVQPYIFAATTAWASFPDGGTVEMTAYVDGKKIHTQIFKLSEQ